MHRAGHRTLWFCEADPYRRRVLARHWPGVPCHPDLTTLDPNILERVDVLIGGTPCQDLSAAGKRKGLDGERSGLFHDLIRVRDHIQPRWTVWENVAGALSSKRGRDFAVVLGAFVGARVHAPEQSGWGSAGVARGPLGTAAWRVLDAQWFGVPQRRKRVFVVADLGGVRAEQVLIERPGGGGDLAQGPEAGQAVAAAFGASVAGTLGRNSGGFDPTDLERGGRVGPVGALDRAGGR